MPKDKPVLTPLRHAAKDSDTQNLFNRNLLQLPATSPRTLRTPSPKSPKHFVFQSPSPSSHTCRSPHRISYSTPSQKFNKTKSPTSPYQGDRFIPHRSSTNTDLAHYMIVNQEMDESESSSSYQDHLNTVLLEGKSPARNSILSFASKNKFVCCKSLENIYEKPENSPCKPREIDSSANRILDAPELIDNFYLNLLDWSVKNVVAVALSDVCYLFDMDRDCILRLCKPNIAARHNYISSVSFREDGNCIGIGQSSGHLQIWDIESQKLLRTIYEAHSPILSLSWNSPILSSGMDDGSLCHLDSRLPHAVIGTIAAHSNIVCGLKWSGDGRYMASGGNDNCVNIWDHNCMTSPQPVLSFPHQSAVKALSWCPWQDSILATGGGSNDKAIHVWSIPSGKKVHYKLTDSQITSLLWSNGHREILSGHGPSDNSLSLWKYPTFDSVGQLKGHTARIINLAISPDESYVASISGDETLRLWKCFKPKKKKETFTHGMFLTIR
ncbi:cell division cycle protein 20 homolog [Argonauta hians]